MTVRRWAGISVVIFAFSALAYLGFAAVRHGFSAREKPSRIEAVVAERLRQLAIPKGARKLSNPVPATAESMKAAAGHWMEHCAICHGPDGRGQTAIGQSLYPKASDLHSARVQQLSDGELFYVITNGIRFTGMPAWGDADSPEEIWRLVTLIRALPKLSPKELETITRTHSAAMEHRSN